MRFTHSPYWHTSVTYRVKFIYIYIKKNNNTIEDVCVSMDDLHEI